METPSPADPGGASACRTHTCRSIATARSKSPLPAPPVLCEVGYDIHRFRRRDRLHAIALAFTNGYPSVDIVAGSRILGLPQMPVPVEGSQPPRIRRAEDAYDAVAHGSRQMHRTAVACDHGKCLPHPCRTAAQNGADPRRNLDPR